MSDTNVGFLLNAYSKFADPDPCAGWAWEQLRAELGLVAASLIEEQREVLRLRADVVEEKRRAAAWKALAKKYRDKIDEYKHEASRCRTIAKAMLDSMDSAGVVVEIGASPTMPGGFYMVVCAPNLNEINVGESCLIVLRELWERIGVDPDNLMVSGQKITGTESDQK